MAIRVIAGSAKGKRLKLVPGDSTRPVMDRVKEALFSILGGDILDAHILDLFAGTGSVGIEALSRGAEFALFVDNNAQAIKTIRKNLALTHLEARASVRRADALRLLEGQPAGAFDIIYIAPPQYMGLWKQALLALDRHSAWLTTSGIAIVQIDPDEQEAIKLTNLSPYDERRYGNTLLWFFQRLETKMTPPEE
ncbi:MAG: 16S rRNA (guanine(966)-N(2))-methyltransferase RsmD [Aggregatilineales bacterium]